MYIKGQEMDKNQIPQNDERGNGQPEVASDNFAKKIKDLWTKHVGKVKEDPLKPVIDGLRWSFRPDIVIAIVCNYYSVILIIIIIGFIIYLIVRSEVCIKYVEDKDNNKITKLNRYGIALLVILFTVIILLIIPSTSKFFFGFFNFDRSKKNEGGNGAATIQNTYTSTSTIDIKVTPTPSPSQTPTPEFTSSPLPTTEHTETPTPFTPVDEFANSCIPSDWKIYPEYLITLDKININEDCLKLDKLGFKALTQGLQVLATTDEDKGSETAGIYRSLPSDNFRLNIVFKDLELNSPNQNGSILYIMFINSQDALSIENISNFGKLFVFNNYYFLYNNYENTYSSEYYYFKPDIEYLLTCDKFGLSLACGLKGLDKEPDFPEIEFNPDWDSVFIGYYLSGDSSVKINITQFHFIPIEP